MLEIQRERLPQAYLLILSGTLHAAADDARLTRALHSASRTGKSAIVVDFTMVEELSESVVELLLAYATVLYTQNRRLALCHVPQTSQHRFLHPDAAFQPLLVTSVLDAIYEVEFALNSPVMVD